MKHYTKTLGGVIFCASEARDSEYWTVTASYPIDPTKVDNSGSLIASRSVVGEFDAGRTFQALIDQHAVLRADVQRDRHLDHDRTVAP